MASYIYHDGGRAEAGYKGKASDCAARSMAIALGIPYKQAYDEIASMNKEHGHSKSARNGVYKEVFNDVLASHGWQWVSAMNMFEGRKARCSDMPEGVVIARQAGHYVAVKNGTPFDTWDCTAKMVYGYWKK